MQVMMQLDSQGLQAQEAAETARREAGKLGMKVLQQQMQVRAAVVLTQPAVCLASRDTAARYCSVDTRHGQAAFQAAAVHNSVNQP